MISRVLGAGFALACALQFNTNIVYAAAAPTAGAPTARILSVDGKGTAMLRKRSGVQMVLAARQELNPGDKITTDPHSVVQLTLPDGTLVRIGYNTEYRIEEARVAGGMIAWVFELTRGSVRALVEKAVPKKDAKFRINTPAGTMGVRGTELLLEHKPKGGLTTLHVIEGKVLFGARDCEKKRSCRTVSTGETATIAMGQSSASAPVPYKLESLLQKPAPAAPAEEEKAGAEKEGAKDAAAKGAGNSASLTSEDGAEQAARLSVLGSIGTLGGEVTARDDAELRRQFQASSKELADLQDGLLGRDEATRQAMARAIANGTFDDRLNLADATSAAGASKAGGDSAKGAAGASGPGGAGGASGAGGAAGAKGIAGGGDQAGTPLSGVATVQKFKQAEAAISKAGAEGEENKEGSSAGQASYVGKLSAEQLINAIREKERAASVAQAKAAATSGASRNAQLSAEQVLKETKSQLTNAAKLQQEAAAARDGKAAGELKELDLPGGEVSNQLKGADGTHEIQTGGSNDEAILTASSTATATGTNTNGNSNQNNNNNNGGENKKDESKQCSYDGPCASPYVCPYRSIVKCSLYSLAWTYSCLKCDKAAAKSYYKQGDDEPETSASTGAGTTSSGRRANTPAKCYTNLTKCESKFVPCKEWKLGKCIRGGTTERVCTTQQKEVSCIR